MSLTLAISAFKIACDMENSEEIFTSMLKKKNMRVDETSFNKAQICNLNYFCRDFCEIAIIKTQNKMQEKVYIQKPI